MATGYRLQFEIKCNLGDERKPNWVTMDWARTKDEGKCKRDQWQDRGPTKMIDHNREREDRKRHDRDY